MILGAACVLLLLAGCAKSERPVLQNLNGQENFSLFRIQSMRGTRDGDRLDTRVMISDSSSILTMDMHFAVGSPTRLESGTWRWSRSGHEMSGSVMARSVTFLGGQDGPPSVGGTFDLTGDNGAPLYRVTLPVAELQRLNAQLQP